MQLLGQCLQRGAVWLVEKIERLHGQRFVTRRHAKDETIAWQLWYNKARLHSTLNYFSPVQFESEWLIRQANS